MCHIITEKLIEEFRKYLISQECSEGTLEKYMRDVRRLTAWLAGRAADREIMTAWKEHLVQNYVPATVNSMLAAVNTFFRFIGWEECRMKFLKIQRQMFRESSKELSKEEYQNLLTTAKRRNEERLALLMETMGSTGVRVSEVRYITVEAARSGRVDISLKGKFRTILLPGKLCRKILKYAKKHKIVSGEIFLTRSGRGMTRGQIWAEMKRLCEYAGVESSKVFPHNLRHLFATTFYRACRDITGLASMLGHSSIETTRIYLLTTGAEHRKRLDCLGLIS